MKRLTCEICGAKHSKSGKAFDTLGLAKHMSLVHGSKGGRPPVALACDICGATGSRRGKQFVTAADLAQHKSKVHPESVAVKPTAGAKHAPQSKSVVSPRKRAAPAVTAARRTHQVKFCPHCGFNVGIVHAAMEFVSGGAG